MDTQAPEAAVRELFSDLGTQAKVFVHVACGAHQMLWENQHGVLLNASREWFQTGTFDEHDRGSFYVDADGQIFGE